MDNAELIIEHNPESILSNHDLFCKDIPVNGHRTYWYSTRLLLTSVVELINKALALSS